jgi:hypothetical protein
MNTTPLSTIFEGDVTLGIGSDTSQFGYGDLNVNRRGWFFGTEDAVSPTEGTLVSWGGLSVKKDAQFGKDTYVLYGTTHLTSTLIDTTNGLMSVTGGNKVYIQVGDNSQFITTGGTLTLSSLTQDTVIRGGLNADTAISLTATDSAGGIQLLSGSGIGGIKLINGSGGLTCFSSSGNINLTCNNASTNIVNNTLSDNQNILIQLNNSTDSQIAIKSAGNNTSRSAILINTTNTAGNILISNNDGLGEGSISVYSGSGGLNLTTNTGGNSNIITQAANANMLLKSSGSGQTLTIGVENTTDSALVISSSGSNTSKQALQLFTSNTSGNILISQVSDSMGAINMIAGRGGFNASTQSGGSVNINAYGNTSLYTNSTMDDYQDLTISVTGNTQSRVNILSEGSTSDAININSTGGIYAYSDGPINIESSNVANGIKIGTDISNVPVYIGTPSNTTTVYGNLNVKGITTTVESVTVVVNDNIMIVNNAPSGTADGGLGIKRWQSANNTGTGDIVIDTPDETGTLRGGSTSTTCVLPISSSAVNDYYSGWWIKLTNGTGSNQVRKIKSYDGTTKVATIYSTSDQTDVNVLNNTIPVEGMDFLTVPDNTSEYSLFPCGYEFMLWNESLNEFSFGCSPNASGNIVHYSNLQVNDVTANNINCTSINNSTADIIGNITLTNNSTTPVDIDAFPYNYGVYMVMVEPVVNTGAYAVFTIGRNGYSGSSGVVARLTSVKGVHSEQLDIQWPADNKPQLLYRPSKGINGTSQYRLKIISI